MQETAIPIFVYILPAVTFWTLCTLAWGWYADVDWYGSIPHRVFILWLVSPLLLVIFAWLEVYEWVVYRRRGIWRY